ncbi:hypothetical protein K1X84_02465 [bacterium]|nr:hypothetical protein [bacterium]
MKFKNFITVLLCIFFIATGCDSDKKQPVEFSTQTEAEQSYEQLQSSQTDPLEIVNKVLEAASFSESFDGSADGLSKHRLGKRRTMMKANSVSFTYNSNTGYWTLDADTTENGVNFSLFYKVRYTPRGLFGLATELTDRMEYETHVNVNGVVVDSSEGALGDSVDVTLDYSENYDIQSDEPFVTNTNFITITGSTSASSEFSVAQLTATASYNYDVHALKIFGPFNDAEDEPEYPESGSIHFTVDYSVTAPELSGSYFIEGTITFDGDNTATLEYGGFTFILNLDDGTVTPV